MRPRATSGLVAGAIALPLALAGCGMGPPATGTAESLPTSMAQAAKTGSDTGSGKTILSENTAQMDQTGAAGMMATGTTTGSMMSGDMMSQMMVMMGAGSAAGSTMSGGSMPCSMDMTATQMASSGMMAGTDTTPAGGTSGTAGAELPAGGTGASDDGHSQHHP